MIAPTSVFDHSVISIGSRFLGSISRIIVVRPSLFMNASRLSVSLCVSRVEGDTAFCVVSGGDSKLISAVSRVIHRDVGRISTAAERGGHVSCVL